MPDRVIVMVCQTGAGSLSWCARQGQDRCHGVSDRDKIVVMMCQGQYRCHGVSDRDRLIAMVCRTVQGQDHCHGVLDRDRLVVIVCQTGSLIITMVCT